MHGLLNLGSMLHGLLDLGPNMHGLLDLGLMLHGLLDLESIGGDWRTLMEYQIGGD
jgi:hypothetical protein